MKKSKSYETPYLATKQAKPAMKTRAGRLKGIMDEIENGRGGTKNYKKIK